MKLDDRQFTTLRAALRAFAEMDPWGDLADYLPAGVTVDDVEALANAADAYEARRDAQAAAHAALWATPWGY